MEGNSLTSLMSRGTKSQEEIKLLVDNYNFISTDEVMSSDLSTEPEKPYIVYGSQKRITMSEKKILKLFKSKGLTHLESSFIFVPEESFNLEINILISKLMGITMQERIDSTGFTFDGYNPSTDNSRLDLSVKKVNTLSYSSAGEKEKPPDNMVKGESTNNNTQSQTLATETHISEQQSDVELTELSEEITSQESVDNYPLEDKNKSVCSYGVPILLVERIDKNVMGLKESLKNNVPEEEVALFTLKFKDRILGKLGINNS